MRLQDLPDASTGFARCVYRFCLMRLHADRCNIYEDTKLSQVKEGKEEVMMGSYDGEL